MKEPQVTTQQETVNGEGIKRMPNNSHDDKLNRTPISTTSALQSKNHHWSNNQYSDWALPRTHWVQLSLRQIIRVKNFSLFISLGAEFGWEKCSNWPDRSHTNWTLSCWARSYWYFPNMSGTGSWTLGVIITRSQKIGYKSKRGRSEWFSFLTFVPSR